MKKVIVETGIHGIKNVRVPKGVMVEVWNHDTDGIDAGRLKDREGCQVNVETWYADEIQLKREKWD